MSLPIRITSKIKIKKIEIRAHPNGTRADFEGKFRLIVRVTGCEHGGETGNLFLAPTDGARFFVLPAAANDLERAFAVNFFLQSPQRTVHRFAFF